MNPSLFFTFTCIDGYTWMFTKGRRYQSYYCHTVKGWVVITNGNYLFLAGFLKGKNIFKEI